MSSFFNDPIFDNASEKRTLTLKQSNISQLAKYVEFINAVNEKRVALEAQARPELAVYRPAKLDESAIVERILEKVLAADTAFQGFLATGEVNLAAPANSAPGRKKG